MSLGHGASVALAEPTTTNDGGKTMDPNATLELFIGYLAERRTLDASEARDNLLNWLERGGFKPRWTAEQRDAVERFRLETPEPGTLSHATMRSADLIPCFMAELERLDPGAARCVRNDYELPEDLGNDDDPWFDSTAASDCTIDLFDYLDARSPSGHYFGSHPGDGSDYGFWADDDDDDGDEG